MARSLRVRNYERGGPDNRRTTKKNAKRRFGDFRSGVWMQTLLRDPAAGRDALAASTSGSSGSSSPRSSLELDHQLPGSLKFLHGRRTRRYSFGADLAGVVFLIGIGWAIVRRYIQRPYRIRIKTKPEDARRSSARSCSSASPASSPKALRIALRRPAQLREVVVHRLPARRGSIKTLVAARR